MDDEPKHDDGAVRAQQQRELLPRQPSDRVVLALLLIGLTSMLVVVGAERWWSPLLLLPAAIAILVQKIEGHRRAWVSEGVERAFVLETSALSFYAAVVALAVVAVLQALGALPAIHAGWLLLGALFVETTVRKLRESRYA